MCWLRSLNRPTANGSICNPRRLEEFEWELRDAANAMRSHRHELPRTILTRILAQGDQGMLLGGARSLTIAPENLRVLLGCLMAAVVPVGFSSADTRVSEPTRQEVAAILAKYGHDDDGMMPYEVFARSLFAGSAVQLANRCVLSLATKLCARSDFVAAEADICGLQRVSCGAAAQRQTV